MFNALTYLYPTNGVGGRSLIQASDGDLYGVCEAGGQFGLGTVFKISPAGILTRIASFDGTNGLLPQSGLVEVSPGEFYGTAIYGGLGYTGSIAGIEMTYGTIYRVTANGNITRIHSFNDSDGSCPVSRLTLGSDGRLYGTASNGGLYTNANGVGLGTMFRISTNGSFTTLAHFNRTNGAWPIGDLVEAADSHFYGTTSRGGAADLGAIFRLTINGTLTNLASFFGTNGATPYGGLIQHSNGGSYGTASAGGAAGAGTFYRFDTNDGITVLASFDLPKGAAPRATLAALDDSNFYGVTQLGGLPEGTAMGTIFRASLSGELTTVANCLHLRGTQPFCTLVRGSNGLFYGTTDFAVFRLDPAIHPQISKLDKAEDWIELTWAAVPGQFYQLERTSHLNPASWSVVPGGEITFSESNNSLTHGFPDSEPQSFYRIMLRP